VLQAYVVEGGGLKPVSADLAKLSEVYWIDIYEPTPAEQKAVEQALDIRLRLPEEPAKFQISTPVRSTGGTITLTALLLAALTCVGRNWSPCSSFEPRARSSL
jgi:Mg2+ and Co2+ transporter CorA